MKKTALYLLKALLPFMLSGQEAPPWVVYYASDAPYEEFIPYEIIALDSDHHPPLERFIENKKTILGYISLGEVEQYRSYFEAVKKEGILLEENHNWPGSYMVDMRSPLWTKRVIEEIIPSILFQQFDGLILDTLDNAEYLEHKHPRKYKGMKAAAVNLVRAIRHHYPQIKIMMNRGYQLLPALAHTIDYELGECVTTCYNFETKTYIPVPEEEVREQVAILHQAVKQNPKLEIFSLDYWDPKDQDRVREIYDLERSHGFSPYVSTIELDQILPEPGAP